MGKLVWSRGRWLRIRHYSNFSVWRRGGGLIGKGFISISLLCTRHYNRMGEVILNSPAPFKVRDGRVARIRELAAAWFPSHKRVTLQAITDQFGTQHHDPQICARILARYWGEVSAHQPVAADRFPRYFAHVQPAPSDAQGQVSFMDFQGLLAKCRDSSPGGDGVPDSAWQNGGDLAPLALFDMYLFVCEGNPVPAAFAGSIA
eukprot:3521022-Pyramimonas_sp.AAC.1